MKIPIVERLIDVGDFSASDEWRKIETHIVEAIQAIEWPPGSGSFTLYPELGKERSRGNGVVPIKKACMTYLESQGWKLETRPDIATRNRAGAIDATYQIGNRLFAVEWETGNISSSHRAVNKMALSILKGILIGGVLILPMKSMAYYLTDRIGNYEELVPYFPLWRAVGQVVDEGLLAVIGIEHDALSWDVPKIPKMTAGRALQ